MKIARSALLALVVGCQVACTPETPNNSGTGGTSTSGGTSSTGGASSGGTTDTGGVSSGGATDTGGANSSGGSIDSGGSSSGGAAATSGGTATGGNPTGGTATGGNATGGTATGGNATGGAATGGNATGGSATGGSASGGTPNSGGTTGSGGTSGTGGSAGSACDNGNGKLTLTSDWGVGYCADVAVSNPGSTAVTSWSVVIDLNQTTLSNSWNGQFTVDGSEMTVLPASSNTIIPPGSSTSFGFCGTAADASHRPTIVCVTETSGAGGAGGSGGAATGGASTGGSATGGNASGGVPTGGSATGGAPAGGTPTGGSATGGVPTGGNATGGKATGGTATGGVPTGGTATGGVPTGGTATGGKATGGVPTGGTATGGKATGGTATGGRGTGGSATGGSGGQCTWSAGPSSSSGELTCYYFGQGTYQGACLGSTKYKTNCGYCGTEGSSSGNACNTSHNDTVQNISTGQYYVAMQNFGQGQYCGMCVSITYGGKTIVATVVDNCATCNSAGHLDLSPAAGTALGMGTGTGQTEDAKNGVTWHTVDCPVSGNIVAVYNGTYAGQIYFQNLAFPIQSATAGGHTGTLSNGFWDFGTSVSGQSVTLTDMLGHVVTGTIPTTNGGSIGAQFPLTCT
jgi:hypothetical protein